MGDNMDYKNILRMTRDKRVIKSLYNTHKLLKDDKNYSIFKYIKMMLNIAKGEKIVPFEDVYVISTFLPPFLSKAFITNIMAVRKTENIFTQQAYAKRSGPISMYLCLTHKCPNNCVYCSSKNRSENEELSTKQWIKVIKDLQMMNVPIIGLTGGEPMVREDIYEIVKSIDSKSVSTLFTSGVNLTLEKAMKLKECGLFSIGISLDSYDKEKHNKNRNNDKAFEYALKAMNIAREAGLYVMAQTVILKEELKEENIVPLFKLAKENGAHEVKILEPILSGNLLCVENLDKILYTQEDREKLIKIQHKANKRKDMPKITTFAYTESEMKFGCGAGTQHSYVSASGDLYPCDFVPMKFGNIKENNINNLWSQMNDTIGNPKIGCFAQKINKKLLEKSKGELPLEEKESSKICLNNRSNRFPKYYRDIH